MPDHQLINAFYALQPNDEQIRLAKLIWQGTADQCKAEGDLAILRKRVFLKRLPASLDTVINQSIEHIRALLSDPNLNKNRRAVLASQSVEDDYAIQVRLSSFEHCHTGG